MQGSRVYSIWHTSMQISYLTQSQLQMQMLCASKLRQESLTGFVCVLQLHNIPEPRILSDDNLGDSSISF